MIPSPKAHRRRAQTAGEAVAVDEVIAQIETDKVTIDVRAPVAGVVSEVLVKEGDTVNVGQRHVCAVDAAAAAAPAKSKKAAGKKAAAEKAAAAEEGPPQPIEVPAMGDSITEGAVAALTEESGRRRAADEVIERRSRRIR